MPGYGGALLQQKSGGISISGDPLTLKAMTSNRAIAAAMGAAAALGLTIDDAIVLQETASDVVSSVALVAPMPTQ